jgi:hypothetical protein
MGVMFGPVPENAACVKIWHVSPVIVKIDYLLLKKFGD